MHELDDTPRHVKKATPPRRKRWGIERWSTWFQEWWCAGWYTSERARDQALEDLQRHVRTVLRDKAPRYRKVNR